MRYLPDPLPDSPQYWRKELLATVGNRFRSRNVWTLRDEYHRWLPVVYVQIQIAPAPPVGGYLLVTEPDGRLMTWPQLQMRWSDWLHMNPHFDDAPEPGAAAPPLSLPPMGGA